MNYLMLILALVFFSCSKSPEEKLEVYIDKEFEIKFHETKILKPDNILIFFDSLITDSRCAIGVMCVWEGEAVIKMKLTNTERETLNCYLKIKGYVNKEDIERHQSTFVGRYSVILMQLDPYPVYDVPREIENYKALVKIERIERIR